MCLKKKFDCPYVNHEVGTCTRCQAYPYCSKRVDFLAAIGLNVEYTPTPISWYQGKSMLDSPHKYDDSKRKQHLYHNNCGETYFQ